MYPIIDKEKTGKKIKELMNRHSLTARDIKEYLSLASVQGIYLWLNGRSIPSIDNLYALSELFQVPLDDLICGNRRLICREGQKKNGGMHRLEMYCCKVYKKNLRLDFQVQLE